MKKNIYVALTSLIVSFYSSTVYAHANLEIKEAHVNFTYKAVMRIGHGCEGSPTTIVRIKIPEGVIKAKPMPKAGWEIEIKNNKYKQSYDYYGKRISEGPSEIAWKGGMLLDDHYDEFVFRVRITDSFKPGDTIFFPTTQECTKGQNAWIEIPENNQDAHDLKKPAPLLKLIEGKHTH